MKTEYPADYNFTPQDIANILARITLQQAEYDEFKKENERKRIESEAKAKAERAEAEAKRAEADAKYDKRMEKLEKLYGGVSDSLGDDAEYYFYRAFKKSKDVFGEHFTLVRKNVISLAKGYEYDIILINDTSIGVIEVKHKLKKDHIKSFIHKKLPAFKSEFPQYKDYRIYAGVAAFSFKEGSETYAIEHGLYVFTRENSQVHLLNPEGFQAIAF